MKNLLIMGFVILTIGCTATQQAAQQPTQKDLSVLNPGTSRDIVIIELGAPAESIVENGRRIDLYSFVQGYSRGTRTARVAGHATAEIMTLGLWSLVGTPIEQNYNGTIMGYKVFYTEDNMVEKSELLVEKGRN